MIVDRNMVKCLYPSFPTLSGYGRILKPFVEPGFNLCLSVLSEKNEYGLLEQQTRGPNCLELVLMLMLTRKKIAFCQRIGIVFRTSFGISYDFLTAEIGLGRDNV